MPGHSVTLAGTGLSAVAYPLSHGGVESTAFLVRSGSDAMLYLGDTGPDTVEHSHDLEALWKEVAPLIRAHELHGIIIECSYDNSRSDKQLYGHMTPAWLLRELTSLRMTAGVPMKDFPVLVSHIKPSLTAGLPAEARIKAQLDAGNADGFRFIIARQGMNVVF
ncbi:MBL fold metallo-hydrolase [Asaia prunellae]|uniref:hypothetical protein n=1 Tax=Asaia prunellae TaxID=610245 RepID=UPI001FB057F5|nr:hypothetical protein [Asaia prunellae]